MSYQNAVANMGVDTRATFIARTYLHLFIAILAFTAGEILLFQSGLAEPLARTMMGGSWLLVLAGFIGISWVATHFAQGAKTLAGQYFGLGIYVLAEIIIFVPLLYIAEMSVGGGVIQSAALATILGFSGLTAIVFMTRKDFSFLRSLLFWGGMMALVMIVSAVLFGFELGTLFSVAMIALAGAGILYDTSNILHHYPENAYVAASLQLFASVAMLFWYVLRLFMARD